MIDKDFKEFNFSDDSKYSDSIFEDEMKDLRVEKLSQRVTIISILIPCLIGVILFIAYRDLTGRVLKSEYSGSKELETLSRALEEKFNTLSTRDKEIQTAGAEKIAALEKAADSLSGNLAIMGKELDNTEKEVKNLADSKLDKKDQIDVAKKIDDAMVPIRKDIDSVLQIQKELKSVSSEISTLDQNLRQELIPLSAALAELSAGAAKTNDNLTLLESRLSTISDAKMSKEDVELELLRVRKIYERLLDDEISKIGRRLDDVQKKIRDLEKGLNQLTAGAAAATPTKVPKAASKSTTGAILEQDIKE